jgi:MFS superfamily sulfate permease-like transporter
MLTASSMRYAGEKGERMLHKARYFSAVGLALGIVLGVLLRNIPLGVVVGVVLAFVIGAIDQRRRRGQPTKP